MRIDAAGEFVDYRHYLLRGLRGVSIPPIYGLTEAEVQARSQPHSAIR